MNFAFVFASKFDTKFLFCPDEFELQSTPGIKHAELNELPFVFYFLVHGFCIIRPLTRSRT